MGKVVHFSYHFFESNFSRPLYLTNTSHKQINTRKYPLLSCLIICIFFLRLVRRGRMSMVKEVNISLLWNGTFTGFNSRLRIPFLHQMIQRQLANNKLAPHLHLFRWTESISNLFLSFPPKITNLPPSPHMAIMTTCVAKREFAVPFLNYNN